MWTKPSRLVFWRLVLAVTSPLACLALWETLLLAKKIGLEPLTSKSWLAMLSVLTLCGISSLAMLILSFTLAAPAREKLLDFFEIIDKFPGDTSRNRYWVRQAGYPLLLVALVAYPYIMFQPYYGELIARQFGIRLFLFWVIALAGAQALKLASSRIQFYPALLITILFQACIQYITLYLPDISTYPFAMGWSETSRFYYPSLFMSREIFGQAFPWPILHPTLHLALLPPYWLSAPLWFHRFWQVAVRFLLVGLIAPSLVYRLNITSRAARWLTGVWIFLELFTLPLYLHLAVPVFIMLWGFATAKVTPGKNTLRLGIFGRAISLFTGQEETRTWIWLVLASIWAGLSRLNWYPMPGILAAALYFLEVPIEKKGWTYLVKPALWIISGTLIAFLSMQAYIAFSGIPNPGDFFTSLSSSKLWYRLWPNKSYPLGVFAGIIIFSAPFWLVMYSTWKQLPKGELPRVILLLGALLSLFAGGLVVSMKIGGGTDIHNMDAYAVLLLVIGTYLFFGPRRKGAGSKTTSQDSTNHTTTVLPTKHWIVVALLVLVPAWFSVWGSASFWKYDPASSQGTLSALQQRVDKVNAQGGEILFITQRHLISMHMLKNVILVPEYEREELMEMAMSKNEPHIEAFRADLEKHRFSAIIVDPLRFNLVGEKEAMGAENNAWARFVVKNILCNYQQEAVFPNDRVAIYVPQAGERKCP